MVAIAVKAGPKRMIAAMWKGPAMVISPFPANITMGKRSARHNRRAKRPKVASPEGVGGKRGIQLAMIEPAITTIATIYSLAALGKALTPIPLQLAKQRASPRRLLLS